jgi:hypothetical protein
VGTRGAKTTTGAKNFMLLEKARSNIIEWFISLF